MASLKTCRICGNDKDNPSYIVREMFLGFRDKFEYFQCGQCGCLQIAEIPSDLSKYYSNDYYTFKKVKDNRIKSFFKNQRAFYALTGNNFIGRLLTGLG
jgi:hypothetical protein